MEKLLGSDCADWAILYMHAEKLYNALKAVLPRRKLQQSDLSQTRRSQVPCSCADARHSAIGKGGHHAPPPALGGGGRLARTTKGHRQQSSDPRSLPQQLLHGMGSNGLAQETLPWVCPQSNMGSGTHPPNTVGCLGKSWSWNCSWHEQFCKCWAAVRGSLENFKAGYTTHRSGWNSIGGSHSTRSVLECKMFWDVTHKYKHTGSTEVWEI